MSIRDHSHRVSMASSYSNPGNNRSPTKKGSNGVHDIFRVFSMEQSQKDQIVVSSGSDLDEHGSSTTIGHNKSKMTLEKNDCIVQTSSQLSEIELRSSHSFRGTDQNRENELEMPANEDEEQRGDEVNMSIMSLPPIRNLMESFERMNCDNNTPAGSKDEYKPPSMVQSPDDSSTTESNIGSELPADSPAGVNQFPNGDLPKSTKTKSTVKTEDHKHYSTNKSPEILYQKEKPSYLIPDEINIPQFELHQNLKLSLSQPVVNRCSFYSVIHDVNKEVQSMALHDKPRTVEVDEDENCPLVLAVNGPPIKPAPDKPLPNSSLLAILDEEKFLLSAIASRTSSEMSIRACPPTFSEAIGEVEPGKANNVTNNNIHLNSNVQTANPLTALITSRTQLWKPSRSWWEAKSGKNPWIEPGSHNKRWRYLWPLIHYHKFLAKCIKKLKRNNVDVKTSVSPVSAFLREEVCAVSDHLAAVSKFSSEEWMEALDHFHGWTAQGTDAEENLRILIRSLPLRSLEEPTDLESPLLRSQIDESFLRAMAAAKEQMVNGAQLQDKDNSSHGAAKQMEGTLRSMPPQSVVPVDKRMGQQGRLHQDVQLAAINGDQSHHKQSKNGKGSISSTKQRRGQRKDEKDAIEPGFQSEGDWRYPGSHFGGNADVGIGYPSSTGWVYPPPPYGGNVDDPVNGYAAPSRWGHPPGVYFDNMDNRGNGYTVDCSWGHPPGIYTGNGDVHPILSPQPNTHLGLYAPHPHYNPYVGGHHPNSQYYHHAYHPGSHISEWGNDLQYFQSEYYRSHAASNQHQYSPTYDGAQMQQQILAQPSLSNQMGIAAPCDEEYTTDDVCVEPESQDNNLSSTTQHEGAEDDDEFVMQTPFKKRNERDNSTLASPYWGHLDRVTLAMTGLATPLGGYPTPCTPQRKLDANEEGQNSVRTSGGRRRGRFNGSKNVKPLLINPATHYNYQMQGGARGVPPSPATQFLMSPQANSQVNAAYFAHGHNALFGSPAGAKATHLKQVIREEISSSGSESPVEMLPKKSPTISRKVLSKDSVSSDKESRNSSPSISSGNEKEGSHS